MVYNIDTILAKVYFKIHETGNLKLLTDENLEVNVLEKIWTEIVQKHQEVSDIKRNVRVFELSKKIEELRAKHEAIINALYVLNFKRDKDLEQIVKNYGYKITDENFEDDVKEIKNNVQIVLNKIQKHQQNLELLLPKEIKKITFEETLLGYYTVLGFGFKDANSITLLEYCGVESQVKAKIKALENGG